VSAKREGSRLGILAQEASIPSPAISIRTSYGNLEAGIECQYAISRQVFTCFTVSSLESLTPHSRRNKCRPAASPFFTREIKRYI
jgi:hypothetical protein